MSTSPTPLRVKARAHPINGGKANGKTSALYSPLTAADKAMFARFRIPPALLQAAHVNRVTHEQALALGFRYHPHSKLAGLVFWYQNRQGQPSAGARLRRDQPDLDDKGKPDAKYLTKLSTERLPFLLPEDYERLTKDPTTKLVIVESEKAKLTGMAWAARTEQNVVYLATGGNYGYLYKPDDEQSYPLPVLYEVLRGRHLTIQYDSNVATNPRVQDARMRLAVFAHTQCHAEVEFAVTPLEDGVNGPDDYIERHTDAEYAATIASARPAYAQPFVTTAEIEAAVPPEFIVKDLIQTQGATIIGGLSSHGKSWLLLLLAKALLDPKITHLFGHFKIMKRPRRVVYITPEVTVGGLKGRLQALDLIKYIKGGQLWLQAISPTPLRLDSAELLMAARDAVVILDPAIRFLEGDEKSNSDVHRSLSLGLFALLQAGAPCVVVGHHAPKAFGEATYMTLENMLRGGGDIGAAFSGAWGVRKMPESNGTQMVLHLENLKPRDMTPAEPFEVQGTPWTDGKLRMRLEPGKCPYLHDRLPHKRGRQPSVDKYDRIGKIQALLAEGKGEKEIIEALAADPNFEKVKASTVKKDISMVRTKKPKY